MNLLTSIHVNKASPRGRLTRLLARIVASVIVAIGIVGVVIPDTLITLRIGAVSTASVYIEATFKVVIGIALALAARHSRAAGTLWLMGAALIVGGLAIPVCGIEGARERLAWESAHLTFFRFEAAFFVLLGAIILSVVLPKRHVTTHPLSVTDGEL